MPEDDNLAEPPETVELTLDYVRSGQYAPGGQSRATVTIRDDEPDVTISASPAAVEEFAVAGGTPSLLAGEAAGVFTLEHDGSTARPVRVELTLDGWAQLGADYLFVGADFQPDPATQTIRATVTIPQGSSSTLFGLLPQDDALSEGEEDVMVLVAGRDSSVMLANGTASRETDTFASDLVIGTRLERRPGPLPTKVRWSASRARRPIRLASSPRCSAPSALRTDSKTRWLGGSRATPRSSEWGRTSMT